LGNWCTRARLPVHHSWRRQCEQDHAILVHTIVELLLLRNRRFSYRVCTNSSSWRTSATILIPEQRPATRFSPRTTLIQPVHQLSASYLEPEVHLCWRYVLPASLNTSILNWSAVCHQTCHECCNAPVHST